MPKYFVDLHIHIGASLEHEPVKITASKRLNIINVIEECVKRKGINIIGIVDCASPRVLNDIEKLLNTGYLSELKGGGLRHKNDLTIILGAEVESCEFNGGRGHYLSFFPTLSQMKEYSNLLSKHIKNIKLSTQQSYLAAQQLGNLTKELGGIFLPAHAFTPHKSLFGSCGDSLEEVFLDFTPQIKVLELGLSSDSHMADTIWELNRLTFISNSDAHSLEKIGREYNIIEMEEPSFMGLKMALYQEKGKIIANYGLDPKLGKYHRSFCENCKRTLFTIDSNKTCSFCLSKKIVKGVYDRLLEIRNTKETNFTRPPYFYQIPLSFLPNIGPKTINKLIDNFGTEMNVLHKIHIRDLIEVAGPKVATTIEMARKGKMEICPGGGGIYGKVTGS